MSSLKTSDGVLISAHHDAAEAGLAIVMAHGFTGSWRRPSLRRAALIFNADPVPEPPHAVAGQISPTPLLVVHGDADAYFPVEHAHQLYDSAREPKELWLEPGFGHAENAAEPELLQRIGAWIIAQT